MKEITTKDGSITYRNKKYDDIYHSTSGAATESLEKYARPALEPILHRPIINILDICFGLGYNTAAAIDIIRESSKDSIIRVLGLENDIEILEKIQKIKAPFKSYNIIKELTKTLYYQYDEKNLHIKLHIGDAKLTINTKQKFDAVFLDPFSPTKQPELWTVDFFKNIKKTMRKGAIMSTYSCARTVRDNLRSAGFAVIDGPVIGRKSPSTLAVNQ